LSKLHFIIGSLGRHVVSFVVALAGIQLHIERSIFVVFLLALAADVEHLFGQVEDLLLVQGLFFVDDDLNQLVPQFQGLLLVLVVVIVADDVFLLSFFLSYQKDLADEILVQFLDDVQFVVLG
jgi:hypothetical protein